ncbi:MAG: intein-containing RctB family protein [Candidatus Omnitrophica bacterium]|nr:intein-containing RctB family protein [Candidatus Omnitrophota bacterium]
MSWNGPLEKITDYKFRIPKSYKQGMRVDGIVYADERLLESIKKDKACEQVANVAFLPGIVKYSLAMPDIHWGYGFSIGGVAATDPEAGGVISPGGVGFDINCLCGNSLILSELGYKIKIKDFEGIFPERKISCMDFSRNKDEVTEIAGFLKQKPKNIVLNLITETGRQITATQDHPFYTRDGMKKLGELLPGEEVAIYPFEGVVYEEPGSEVIVDVQDIKRVFLKLRKHSKGSSLEQTLIYLKNKNLASLRYDSLQLPYLIKLMGYCFGDGLVYFSGEKRRGICCFYGKEEDLQKIKEDLEKIGFRSGIYTRKKHHKIKTAYSTVEFDRQEYWLKVFSGSFAVLMAALGVPVGNKCHQSYGLPKWLFKAPLWQKRLFLAGLFGAELSSPKTMTGHGYNFYCPTLSMNKLQSYLDNGRDLLEGIAGLLSEFGVFTYPISQRKEYVNKEGLVSYRLRLMVLNKTDNLINLYGKVGFEYNHERKFLSNLAVQYLRLKRSITRYKQEVAVLAPKLFREEGWAKDEIYSYLSCPHITGRFIERSLYEPRKTGPRMWTDFPVFNEFVKKATEGLDKSGMVWEGIKSIYDIDFDDWVYDFTVVNPYHNFVANNFIVSNCGVRLLKTHLTFGDVKDKTSKIVDSLYNNVPSGVGSKGDIKVSYKEEERLLVQGAGWAVKKGMGIEEDLECCEESGAIEGADPDSVSQRAFERGKQQAGTLGSGNHFLEVQCIDEIFDVQIAEQLGLFAGQVTVMIHSGSRGLGYQVCDDNTREMVKCLDKYNINVPDRQLACAPVETKEAKRYIGAMRAAANYAWANRQVLMHLVRESFEKVFSKSWQSLGMYLIYDIAHNIAKFEKYVIDGKEKTLCVHRKGATRAFGPGNPVLPQRYRQIGQPVIIPGDMGRASYLLLGTKKAEEEAFGSTCHGAGRLKSRHEALRTIDFNSLIKDLDSRGIQVRATGKKTIVEEAPSVYKNVDEVVDVVDKAGLSRKICRMKPLCVVKG